MRRQGGGGKWTKAVDGESTAVGVAAWAIGRVALAGGSLERVGVGLGGKASTDLRYLPGSYGLFCYCWWFGEDDDDRIIVLGRPRPLPFAFCLGAKAEQLGLLGQSAARNGVWDPGALIRPWAHHVSFVLYDLPADVSASTVTIFACQLMLGWHDKFGQLYFAVEKSK
ncbi:hypothetical protein CDL15_Pgr002073 [Punica granatum]|uniref:Uncharacterized protein n=1 Tax=Punica granatum TaxID=22663 RepID=A0A218XCI3_PUNGR|nr:hypothetical protein CDL15_Pgr002073 [Punica granatum]